MDNDFATGTIYLDPVIVLLPDFLVRHGVYCVCLLRVCEHVWAYEEVDE